MLASKHISHEQLIDLYEVIAIDTSVPTRYRLIAAIQAFEAALLAGMGLMVRLTRDRAIRTRGPYGP